MALTVVTVNGSLSDPAGLPAKGRVYFQLINDIAETQSDEMITRRPVVRTLDASGDFSVNLYASNSNGSVPPATAYKYMTVLEGVPIEEKFFVLDGGLSTINIADLLEIKPGSDLLTSPTMRIIRKPSEEIVNNSVALQNDDHLFYALLAGEIVDFEFELYVIGPDAADMKISIAAPAGASGHWGVQALTAAVTTISGDMMSQSTTVFGGAGLVIGTDDALSSLAIVKGTCVNGGTPGNLQLNWAQNTATVGDTKILTNSKLKVGRIV